jgi:hypothetical protein
LRLCAEVFFLTEWSKRTIRRYARAGEEITILHSIYADRKPSHRKPSHAKEKTSQTVLHVYAYTLRSQRNHSPTGAVGTAAVVVKTAAAVSVAVATAAVGVMMVAVATVTAAA